MSFNNTNVNNINADFIESLAGKLELVITALDSRSLFIPEDLAWMMTEILIEAKKIVKSYPVNTVELTSPTLVKSPVVNNSVVNMGICNDK